MAEICTPDDVAEVLGLESTPDAPWAERKIESAISWAKTFLGMPDLGESTTTFTVREDVRCDAYIRCPGEPTKVSVLWAPGDEPEVLAEDAWTFDGFGVRLRPAGEFGVVGRNVDPRVSSVPQSMPWYYVRVTVESAVEEEVDPLIREGVAIAAAALLVRGPREAKGLSSERIGDYSYSVKSPQPGADPFFAEAKSLLRPFRVSGPLTP